MDIPFSGDVVNNVLLRIVWPNTSNVNISVGTAMIQMVELRYGDVVIERVYGENMYIMNDFMVPQGKRGALTNLTGMDITTPLNEYYVKLPFTMKIPLCALNNNPTVRVIFNQPSTFMSVPYYGPLQLKLVVEYVLLSQTEYDYMQTTPLVYTTQFFQQLQFTVRPSETTFNIVTSFIGNVKELFWVIQEPQTPPYTYRDDLVNLSLTFNGLEFLSPLIGTNVYLSKIQPLEHHTKTPSSNVYLYSFSIDPENHIPTGEVNLTGVINQMHTLTLTPYSNVRYVRIYAWAYNQATVENGEVTMKYTLTEAGFKN
jgi:Large eukaryotic DNA virus major capsid protein/Major capsid protein N-terminus